MTVTLSAEQLEQVKGAEVTTGAGQQVGGVVGIYLDESRGEPEWALVNTPGSASATPSCRCGRRPSREGP
jgi:hypothetical protein